MTNEIMKIDYRVSFRFFELDVIFDLWLFDLMFFFFLNYTIFFAKLNKMY